ncbi:MAG: phenylalanine--tRNA ligase subunit beta [Candidatus Omnitrophica bacterium]|nr:phenylalanine--tRNA ligase subunit beta [Candidatus Omnitrophota bacterium]
MKISYKWLKEYVDIKASAEEVIEKLTFAGLEVGDKKKINNDVVFDIEITSNRPDWLSHIGIARELAALFNAKIKKVKADTKKAITENSKEFSISIEDKKACSRYVGRLIKNVKIAPSPKWIEQPLTNISSRLINNGADITNFCLHETGQPLHAFDFDKLEGAKIIVRRAKKGETITTIDGVKRELDESILVISDAKKPVAVAGIMGGIDTEVTQDTKNILLESAYFDPVTIRRASRKLGLSTESNYRFERKVDFENVLFSSNRAALLFKEVTGADISLEPVDKNYGKKETRAIKFDCANIKRLIGAEITLKQTQAILTALGFEVEKTAKKGVLKVTVPSFRNDVLIEEDLIEEVVRIWGYDKVEPSMPVLTAHVEPAYSKQYSYKQKIRQIMIGLGMDEAVTYSLLSRKNLVDSYTVPDDLVTLINPLSHEQQYMRSSLLASFLKVINTNFSRRSKEMKIFEIGKVYGKAIDSFDEYEVLSIALCGKRFQNWQGHSKELDFFDIKGIVEVLLDTLGIKYEFKQPILEFYSPEESLGIIVEGNVCAGHFGKLDKKMLKHFDITNDVYFAELNITTLVDNAKTAYKFSSLAKYPSSSRDVAIVVNNSVSAKDALSIIREVSGSLAVNIELFDVYTGDQVPDNHKSLAFSIEYQSKEATLTEEQITATHTAVQDALLKRLNASLR